MLLMIEKAIAVVSSSGQRNAPLRPKVSAGVLKPRGFGNGVFRRNAT